MSAPSKPVLEMSREEILAYVHLLEQQVRHDGAKIEFLNATVRKLESDAVVTVAAMVDQLGGRVVIKPDVVKRLRTYQIGRATLPDGSSVFETKLKEPALVDAIEGIGAKEVAPDGALLADQAPIAAIEGIAQPDAFSPDGL